MGQKYVYNPLTCEYDIINEGAPGVPGPRGPVGPTGPAGRGIAEGGTEGQYLAKASDDDFDTTWTDAVGATPTLEEVLAAGDSAADADVTIYSSNIGTNSLRLTSHDITAANDSTGKSIGLTSEVLEAYDLSSNERVWLDQSGVFVAHLPGHEGESTSIGRASFTLRQTGGTRYMSFTAASGIPVAHFVDENGYASLSRVNESGSANLELPTTNGAEILATREWVMANGGGGGGNTPGIDEVLGVDSEAFDKYIFLRESNSDGELTLSPGSINISGQGTAGHFTGAELAVSDDTGFGAARLTGYNGKGHLTLVHSGGETTLTVNTSDSGGELIMPGTISPETLATREWVATQTASGATGSRPVAPQVGSQFFDTTLGHPIWYDGSQWVDATGTGV